MAFSASDLEALEQAIATGELRVTVDGRTVEYRSVADLVAAHRFAQRQLAAASRPSKRRGRYNPYFSDSA